ncbi:MAG: YeeE/YedE family protein [Pseudomonadales bacterium]
MKSTLSAFVAGLVFGFGLILSEMVNPRRVQGFLDITGSWDPTLAFVMGGALVVSGIGYRLVFAMTRPVFSDVFAVPTNRTIDKKLVIGALLFGVGWGVAGLCPGPAIVGAGTGEIGILVFVLFMVVGMKFFEKVQGQFT